MSVSSILSLFSFFLNLSTGDSGTLKSFTINVWGLMCDLNSSNISFTNVDALVFGAQMFGSETSSW